MKYLPFKICVCLAFAFLFGNSSASAQFQGLSGESQAQRASAKTTQENKQKGPWSITSRIHLEKGTNKGYLVVRLDLKEGYHVYSVNPKGSPSPTKFEVPQSNDLRLLSKFASENPPKVIQRDPVFNQRMEKHSGKVQFFATVEVRPGIDLKKLNQEVLFSGQVCSDQACQPIRKHKTNAEFAGYFQLPEARNAESSKNVK